MAQIRTIVNGLPYGLCSPDRVQNTASLPNEIPTPTEAEVRANLSGTLCRCTGARNTVKTVLAASGQDVFKEVSA